MAPGQTDELTPRKPLRLWPGVAAALLLCVLRFVIPIILPSAGVLGVLGAFVCGAVIVLWWLFFSRAAWAERLGAIALMAAGLFATSRVVDKSIATGMMGMLLPIYAIPILCLTLVAWAVASRRLSGGLRLASLVGATVLACGTFTLIRTFGITGEG